MGDRSNVVIETNNYAKNADTGKWEDAPADETTRVYLYSHWGGQEAALKAAMAGANSGRSTDGPYLARIVFQALLGGDESETGFGISPSITDNEHPIIVLNADDGTARIIDGKDDYTKVLYGPVPMAQFVEDADQVILAEGDQYRVLDQLIASAK